MNITIDSPFCDIRHEYPDFIINMYCFKCSTQNPEFKMNVHKDFKWLDISELNTLDWAEADKPAVKKLLEE